MPSLFKVIPTQLSKYFCGFSPACGGRSTISLLGEPGKLDWVLVRKLGNDRQITAHGLDIFAKSGNKNVRALFEARNAILSDPECLCDFDLGAVANLPQPLARHLLPDQLPRARLNFLATGAR